MASKHWESPVTFSFNVSALTDSLTLQMSTLLRPLSTCDVIYEQATPQQLVGSAPGKTLQSFASILG